MTAASSVDIPPDFNNPPRQLPLKSYGLKYQHVSNLGNGSFGCVELAKYKGSKRELTSVTWEKKGTMMDPLVDSENSNNHLVAIKTMKKKLPTLYEYTQVKEIKFIMAIPSHPCLVQIYEIFVDDINYQLHISMEAMSQNLYQLMKARKNMLFSPITLRCILTQILCAIKHIHNHGYYHRDVKPENILVVPTSYYYNSKELVPQYRRKDNYVVKLADYGLAREVHNVKTYTAYVLTRWYRSPEILLRQKHYSRPIDMWAFGCVAAEVANFYPLFPGTNELDQIWKILKVLGNPIKTSFGALNTPLGGYWNDALILSGKLGFVFPETFGRSMDEVLTRPVELAKVIQACLTWDPNTRATVEEVCEMPYFKISSSIKEYSDPVRSSHKLKNEPTRPFQTSANVLNPFTVKRSVSDVEPNINRIPIELEEESSVGDYEESEEEFDIQQFLEPNDEYVWKLGEDINDDSIPRTLPVFDDDFGVVADVSFGSTQEINA